ncbi:MAG: MFS transporter, partial [Ruminococcus sp.]|nr:MFS transporter [Ruminococcus sp.]
CFFLGANNRFLNPWIFCIIMLLVSIIYIPTNMKDIAHRALIADSIDEVELKTGERTEGISFSMQNFVSKLTGAVSKFIQGYLLRWLGFNEKITDAAGNMLEGTAAIRAHSASTRFVRYRWHQFMLGPAIGSALYLIVILFLRDDRSHMEEVERRLREKRETAAEQTEAVAVSD